MILFQIQEGEHWLERGRSVVLSRGGAGQTWLKFGWVFWNTA